MKPLVSLIALFLLLICPVSAEVMSAYDVSSYSVAANPGNVVYQIIVDPVPMGTNQTHVLIYNGATFLLTIGSKQTNYVIHDFDISLTYPNGTVESKHVSTWRVSSGSYKTTIQPVFTQAESLTNSYLTVDLEVGLTPVSAGFNTQPAGWLANTAIPFTSASGDLGYTTNVFVWQMSMEDFENNVVNYNPIYGVKNLGETVFQWTWDSVLGFIGMIPVIGPLFLTVLDIAGTVIAEMVFWLSWIVARGPAVILAAEVLIGMAAVINSKSARPEKRLYKLVKNLIDYNVMVLKGFIWLFEKVFEWTKEIIKLISYIIQALKPV